MNIQAKPLLKNKLWILEANGEKFGALQKSEDGYTIIRETKKEKFMTPEELAQHYAITYEKTIGDKKTSKKRMIYNMPCSDDPHNEMYNVQNNFPVYTKDKFSKSYYCAGYYLININDNGWEKYYCPKLIMVERYPYYGPFKTIKEMEEEYLKINA